MEDALCIYALISTRGPDHEELYKKLLEEKTKELLVAGWVADPNMPARFYPPTKQ